MVGRGAGGRPDRVDVSAHQPQRRGHRSLRHRPRPLRRRCVSGRRPCRGAAAFGAATPRSRREGRGVSGTQLVSGAASS
jgi:hypothetical protein